MTKDLDLVEMMVVREVARLRERNFPLIDTLVIRTEWENEEESELYGLFCGTPENEFCVENSGQLPNEIVLYAKTLVADFGHGEVLEKEIRITLLHELGHAFGFSEEELMERGLG